MRCAALLLAPPARQRAVVLLHCATILFRHRRARAERGPARLRDAELARERELEVLETLDHGALQPLDRARVVECGGAAALELAQRRDRLLEISRVHALRGELAPQRLGVLTVVAERARELTRIPATHCAVAVARRATRRILSTV